MEILEYKSEIIMDTFRAETIARLGEPFWTDLTDKIGVPDIRTESQCGCRTTRALMRRFDSRVGEADAKAILTRVRHGLKREQFQSARKKFVALGSDIDAFIEQTHREQADHFHMLCKTGADFYGQPITREVLDYVLNQPGLLSPLRKGNQLVVAGFPFDMVNYLKETDERKKRYHACHCPFARASILADEGAVSSTICYCSLGHAKILWEALLDRELDGHILSSVLRRDLSCQWVIELPSSSEESEDHL